VALAVGVRVGLALSVATGDAALVAVAVGVATRRPSLSSPQPLDSQISTASDALKRPRFIPRTSGGRVSSAILFGKQRMRGSEQRDPTGA
jgi:hypothetical protein